MPGAFETLSFEEIGAIMASVASPRPLAWITTLGPGGEVNIAPFNSYTALANAPPLIGISFSARGGGPKDTVANIERSGEFVVNVVTRSLAERMNESAREGDAHTDDLARLGLEAAVLEGVAVPRIAESPAALACRLQAIFPLPPSKCRLVVARVVGAYVGAGYDPVAEDTIASVGALRYASLRDPFTMPKTWG
jgi:flavin reductase (DIM6/NTAB) family NADH-FMN oxidoreductase RutF